MRGVRAFRKAPLLLLLALLATCDFSLKIEQPAIELDLETAFISGNTLNISYKFATDEPVLRCRYAVNRGTVQVLSGVSGQLTPGVLYSENIVLPGTCGNGIYLLELVGQVERSGKFVDMASLSQRVEFGIDIASPAHPDIGMVEGGRYAPTDLILLDHEEWPEPDVSPVRIRYIFDGDPLSAEATEVLPQAGEYPIAFPPAVVSSGVHTLRAVAIDEAGNLPSPTETKQFYFLKIDTAIDSDTETNSAHMGDISNVEISGYTFQPSDTVELYDVDGTKAELFGSPMIESYRIQVGFDLRPSESPGIDLGEGYIKVTTSTPNVTSTTIRFAIIP